MKVRFRIILLVVVAILATNVSCKSTKNVPETTQQPTSVLPCSETCISDSDFFRACGNAMSSNINLAREKALASAKSELGKKIMDRAMNATKLYVSETRLSDKATFTKDMELIVNKAIDQTFNNIVPICENYNEANSKYTAYIAVEFGKSSIIDKICNLATEHISDFEEKKFKIYLDR